MKLQTLKAKVAVLNTLSRATAMPVNGGRIRGRPWARMRESILRRDSYQCQCGECQASGYPLLADEVDHIVPLFQGGSDEPSNLRAINRDCHAKKTRQEQKQGGGGYFKNSGRS